MEAMSESQAQRVEVNTPVSATMELYFFARKSFTLALVATVSTLVFCSTVAFLPVSYGLTIDAAVNASTVLCVFSHFAPLYNVTWRRFETVAAWCLRCFSNITLELPEDMDKVAAECRTPRFPPESATRSAWSGGTGTPVGTTNSTVTASV